MNRLRLKACSWRFTGIIYVVIKLPGVKRTSTKILLGKFLLLFIGVALLFFSTHLVNASHCAGSDYDCQISEIQREIDALTPAHEANKQQLASLNSQIASINSRITNISAQLTALAASIAEREEDLAFAREVFDEKTNNHYKFLRIYDPLAPFLFSSDASEAFREINFRQKAADEDRKTMEEYVADLFELKTDKENLEKNQASLATAKANLNSQAKFLGGEIDKVENYLASLSARQNEIVAKRSGGFTVSVGDSELADDYYASITGFREQAPSGYFAVFSFGAYSHRNGMSQYGARGRALAGQSAEQILAAYYPGKELRKDYSEPGSIHVRGQGKSCFLQPDGTFNKYYDETVDFNTYLKRIWEVPESWPQATLRAQAVAARTYAIRVGGPMQPNQSHQVYKDCEKGGGWPEAVEQTRGWILLEGGSPAFTEYSSTAGGWLKTSGWDTTDSGGGQEFIDKAYEKTGGSPWLYKAWYTEGTSVNSAKCGRSNPWLSPTELADIANAATALKTQGIDTSRITPVTTSCWGGNPYSHDELRNLLGSNGISQATSVSVSLGNGITNSVTINGKPFTPEEFRKAFNLRAPGFLSIPQSTGVFGAPFFNIEKK